MKLNIYVRDVAEIHSSTASKTVLTPDEPEQHFFPQTAAYASIPKRNPLEGYLFLGLFFMGFLFFLFESYRKIYNIHVGFLKNEPPGGSFGDPPGIGRFGTDILPLPIT